MNAEKAQIIIVAILTSLLETGGEAPSGHIYAALMNECTLQQYNKLVGFGVSEQLWTRAPSHLVTLTDKGRDAARRVTEVLAAAKAGEKV